MKAPHAPDPRAVHLRAVPAAGPALLLDVHATLERLAAQSLPQLEQARQALTRQMAAAGLQELERALASHRAALDGLQFELLVPRGVRAGPLERDETRFHQQVAAVSACTEASWAGIRAWLESRQRQAADVQARASDLALEVRNVQREVETGARALGQLVAGLRARAGVAGNDVSRSGLASLLARAEFSVQRVARMRTIGEAGRHAQQVAWELEDESRELAGHLKKLAQGLSGGLLERLRALVAPGVSNPTEELREARLARDTLVQALAEATAAMAAQRAHQQALADALKVLAAACRAWSAPDFSDTTPMALPPGLDAAGA